MTKPMTDEELASFWNYAKENMTEEDGTQCQWADYTVRLIEDFRHLREENECWVKRNITLQERLNRAAEKEIDLLSKTGAALVELREENEQTRNDWNSMRAEVDGAAIEICRLKEVNKNNVANYQLQVTALHKVVDAALSCWPDADHMPTPEQLAAFFKALREAR